VSTLRDGTIVRVNRTLLEWVGASRESILSTRIQTLLTIGSRMYYETHYAPLLRMQAVANEIALVPSTCACRWWRRLPAEPR